VDVDSSSAKEIDKLAAKVLREAGITRPPVKVEDLLEHLKVHREFYSLADPTLLQRLQHKVLVKGIKLVNVIKKIRLSAVWLPDEDRILVDEDLPSPKREWASFHDATHSILEWHRPYFLGDTAQTLDPDFQEVLEAEANYGASALMFCGNLFTTEALDLAPEWASVVALKNRHKKSWVTTLRRYVEHSHDLAMAMMVSTPWWKSKPEDQATRCRHFIVSPRFAREMALPIPEAILQEVDAHTQPRAGGLVGEFGLSLMDSAADPHEFKAQSFFNQHYVLTLFVHQRRMSRRSFDQLPTLDREVS
jgi:hypothetical protein